MPPSQNKHINTSLQLHLLRLGVGEHVVTTVEMGGLRRQEKTLTMTLTMQTYLYGAQKISDDLNLQVLRERSC